MESVTVQDQVCKKLFSDPDLIFVISKYIKNAMVDRSPARLLALHVPPPDSLTLGYLIIKCLPSVHQLKNGKERRSLSSSTVL